MKMKIYLVVELHTHFTLALKCNIISIEKTDFFETLIFFFVD